ncbi:hypothetical protein, partial [Mesorhizobium sp. M1E.F.Ca.ET.063.01.1.1]|uniref:hypothetical protein n=1 Tax=Mesorhizobium sp. M1E.F.Ca.ET.063.01.1.1 TaxID=2496750 RepID=UPI001AEC7EA6
MLEESRHGRIRHFQSFNFPAPHFFQHPSSVSALRADPPSPTRVFGPGTSRTGVRRHREQFCMLSGEGIEVDGFYFLMS